MKKIIRNKAFETNSSSNHTISLSTDEKPFIIDMLYPDETGTIVVNGDKEFGWEWEKINDSESKLQYAYISGVDEKILTKILKYQIGCKKVIFNEITGYIDHESYGILSEIENDEEKLRDFIFNKNSWLITGNDNSSKVKDYFITPIYTENGLIPIKYNYKLYLSCDKLNYEKFINYPDDDDFELIVSDLSYNLEIKENNTTFSRSWRNNLTDNKSEIFLFDKNAEKELEKKMLSLASFKRLNFGLRYALLHKILLKSPKNYKKIDVIIERI